MGKLILNKIFFVSLVLILSPVFSKSKLLIVRTQGSNFEEVKRALEYELSSDFDFVDFVIDNSATPEIISKEMALESPQIVVLMNNTSITNFKKYQAALPEGAMKIPSVSLMGILVGEKISGIENATGIGYEIPIVTSCVNLRAILGINRVKKIGIVHRHDFSTFIADNRQFCESENFELITSEVPTVNNEASLTAALNELTQRNIDALWVPNDNKIISPALLTDVWIPFLKRHKIPVIVGVKNLVEPHMQFGTFAVLPDHSALGSQAASLVSDIMANNWEVAVNGEMQPALSVHTILNFTGAKVFGVTKDHVGDVDLLLE